MFLGFVLIFGLLLWLFVRWYYKSGQNYCAMVASSSREEQALSSWLSAQGVLSMSCGKAILATLTPHQTRQAQIHFPSVEFQPIDRHCDYYNAFADQYGWQDRLR